MLLECPECKAAFECAVTASIPKDQTLYMKLSWDSELLDAATIGEAITNMQKLQVEVAKANGIKVAVFLKSVDLKPREITIGFQIIQSK